MKTTLILILMTASACALAVVGCLAGSPYLGISTAATAILAILALTDTVRLWKPWFMAGVQAEDPPALAVFLLQAMLFDGLAIAGFFSGFAAPALVFRLLGAVVQLSYVGKMKNEIFPKTDEIRRKSDPSADTRATRQ